jgi:hypothetical protein
LTYQLENSVSTGVFNNDLSNSANYVGATSLEEVTSPSVTVDTETIIVVGNPTLSPTSDPGGYGAMSGGAIAGIVIGIVLLLCLVYFGYIQIFTNKDMCNWIKEKDTSTCDMEFVGHVAMSPMSSSGQLTSNPATVSSKIDDSEPTVYPDNNTLDNTKESEIVAKELEEVALEKMDV